MGGRENRKLRATESASSAKKQLWGQKDNLEHSEEDLWDRNTADPHSAVTQCGGLGTTQTWKATWVRVRRQKG